MCEFFMYTVLIGERGEPSAGRRIGNFVFLHMPVFGLVGIYLCICYTFITWRVHRRSYGLDWKGNSRHDDDIDCRLEDQRNLDLTCYLCG